MENLPIAILAAIAGLVVTLIVVPIEAFIAQKLNNFILSFKPSYKIVFLVFLKAELITWAISNFSDFITNSNIYYQNNNMIMIAAYLLPFVIGIIVMTSIYRFDIHLPDMKQIGIIDALKIVVIANVISIILVSIIGGVATYFSMQFIFN